MLEDCGRSPEESPQIAAMMAPQLLVGAEAQSERGFPPGMTNPLSRPLEKAGTRKACSHAGSRNEGMTQVESLL